MHPTFLALALPLAFSSSSLHEPAGAGDWPGWRGPNGCGAGSGSPPTAWSEEKNVRWKAALPGKGLASPIVWGKHVFVTSAIPTGKKLEGKVPGRTEEMEKMDAEEGLQQIEEQDFVVLAFDRATGKELWRKVVARAMPHQTTHPDGSYAAPTPVTEQQLRELHLRLRNPPQS